MWVKSRGCVPLRHPLHGQGSRISPTAKCWLLTPQNCVPLSAPGSRLVQVHAGGSPHPVPAWGKVTQSQPPLQFQSTWNPHPCGITRDFYYTCITGQFSSLPVSVSPASLHVLSSVREHASAHHPLRYLSLFQELHPRHPNFYQNEYSSFFDRKT